VSTELREDPRRDPVHDALSGPIGLRRIVAGLMLVVALVFGAMTAHRALRDDRTTLATMAAAPLINGRLPLFHNSADQFVDYVRGLVPEGAKIRILQPIRPVQPGLPSRPGTPGQCGNEVATPTYWLLVYELLPRPSVCEDPNAWTIFFGIPVPDGPGVHRFSATMGVQAP
jgi:hypothetical protein